MKRIISSLLVVLCLLLPVTGCNKEKTPAKDVAASELAQALLDGISFQDSMSPVDESAVTYLFQLDGISLTEYAVYESTGATAEEIAVLKAGSSKDAELLKEKVNARVAAQKIAYENYVPEELVKLGKPVIETSGNCVILCVTDEDEKAKEIIHNCLT